MTGRFLYSNESLAYCLFDGAAFRKYFHQVNLMVIFEIIFDYAAILELSFAILLSERVWLTIVIQKYLKTLSSSSGRVAAELVLSDDQKWLRSKQSDLHPLQRVMTTVQLTDRFMHARLPWNLSLSHTASQNQANITRAKRSALRSFCYLVVLE